MIKAAVVLSGCGFRDGAEIFESVFTLMELDRHKVDVEIFAPNIKQHQVVNHLTGQQMQEERNVLVESARIARGKIKALSNLQVEDFDTLILPGGFGAAINLSDIGLKNEQGIVIEELKDIIIKFHKLSKPIGAICISPTLLASVLRDYANIKITLGASNQLITKMGAIEETSDVQDIVIDEVNKIITTPAFMIEASLSQVSKGISNLVQKITEMC